MLVFAAETEGISRVFSRGSPEPLANQLARSERQRRKAFTAPLHRAADAYLVSRGTGTSIIAGYPRFTDLPGTGHLPEVADGDFPHRPGGCPFQAWSVGEALRVERVLSGTPAVPPGTGPLQAHRQLSNPSG